MDLIPELKQQHRDILYSFKGIRSTIKAKTTEDFDLVTGFRELKDILVNHLELEDKLLYPFFAKSRTEELKQLGKSFSSQMLKISKSVMAFFNKYERKSLAKLRHDAKFQKELDSFINAVTKRVRIEEDILFPAFSKYSK